MNSPRSVRFWIFMLCAPLFKLQCYTKHSRNSDRGIMMGLFKKFKKFYKSSAENRIQTHVFLAFLIIPVIGMIGLYVWVNIFWLH
ncbi:hypothetical protein Lbir_1817 [Legionella birminghamensis]|uniref:Transmembrane protein n=1 Tax=Legionella birminghamensis TaxID=28083 RepID=A0A378I588_9GAMM|nr:hypothetical protein Lbir_1817 [Legionella birminghamensis]STX30358.1 Uncharacterised protein [Legionella birminghamensis]